MRCLSTKLIIRVVLVHHDKTNMVLLYCRYCTFINVCRLTLGYRVCESS